MSRRQDVGICRVWTKGDTASFPVHPDDHAELEKAWMAGKPFATVTALDGGRLTLRLGEVIGIGLATPAQIAEFEAQEAEDRLTGGEA